MERSCIRETTGSAPVSETHDRSRRADLVRLAGQCASRSSRSRLRLPLAVRVRGETVSDTARTISRRARQVVVGSIAYARDGLARRAYPRLRLHQGPVDTLERDPSSGAGPRARRPIMPLAVDPAGAVRAARPKSIQSARSPRARDDPPRSPVPGARRHRATSRMPRASGSRPAACRPRRDRAGTRADFDRQAPPVE